MANTIAFDSKGYPIWRSDFTTEEKRKYRKHKHRCHAQRSRRLRGKEAPYLGEKGKRTVYTKVTEEENCLVYPNRMFPIPGDYDDDGIPD